MTQHGVIIVNEQNLVKMIVIPLNNCRDHTVPRNHPNLYNIMQCTLCYMNMMYIHIYMYMY